MWKKQAPNACFNLFLVLLLSQISVAVFDNSLSCSFSRPSTIDKKLSRIRKTQRLYPHRSKKNNPTVPLKPGSFRFLERKYCT